MVTLSGSPGQEALSKVLAEWKSFPRSSRGRGSNGRTAALEEQRPKAQVGGPSRRFWEVGAGPLGHSLPSVPAHLPTPIMTRQLVEPGPAAAVLAEIRALRGPLIPAHPSLPGPDPCPQIGVQEGPWSTWGGNNKQADGANGKLPADCPVLRPKWQGINPVWT